MSESFWFFTILMGMTFFTLIIFMVWSYFTDKIKLEDLKAAKEGLEKAIEAEKELKLSSSSPDDPSQPQ